MQGEFESDVYLFSFMEESTIGTVPYYNIVVLISITKNLKLDNPKHHLVI
jgi:hypothetical protein